MKKKPFEIDSETSRIRAVLVNSGRNSFEEAEEKLASSALALVLGGHAAATAAGQAAFLTAVVTGTRAFGRLTVQGSTEEPLLLPLPAPVKTLAEAASFFGAQHAKDSTAARSILIGSEVQAPLGWAVRAVWNGWSAGVTPARTPTPPLRSDIALAGIAAGALAVGQAFLAEQGGIRAARTTQALSLWSPGSEPGILAAGPAWSDARLPKDLWLVGLGNLGQAHLWALTLLPYPRPGDVLLVFQDDQCIGKENWCTSILVKRSSYGMLKTRCAEQWALKRGFQVRRIDRRLDGHLARLPSEPGIALAGLDSISARRLLGGRGFDYVIDAGLGATAADYRKFRVNVFDSAANPSDHFAAFNDQGSSPVEELMQLPAYKDLAERLGDGGCGAATLAGRSVAVPFVSALVGALSVTQALRIASGEAPHVGTTGDAGDLRSVRSALGEAPERLLVDSIPAAC